jgi:single-strand DNA-binding protein
MNVNKVIIVGNVTAAPQLRNTPSGQAVTTFGVATNRIWKDKAGNRQEQTEFHNVVAWGRTAEIASQYLTKGGLVFVEGRLQTRSWTDKQNVNRKTTEIICERLQLGPRPAGGGSPAAAGRPAQAESQAESHDVVKPAEEDVPVIDLEDDIKPEDLPF